MKITLFLDLTPCSPFKVNRRGWWPPTLTLISCSAYSLNLKMEVTCSFETSLDFQRITWRYISDILATASTTFKSANYKIVNYSEN
jgi:hypothetical protein